MAEDGNRPAIERRAEHGAAWLDELTSARAVGPPHLARRGDGRVFLIEGSTKRNVKSGIVAAALEQSLGRSRPTTDADLAAKRDGTPVEIFEDGDGQPFLVIGGEFRRARGVPFTYPVDSSSVGQLNRGADIDLARANVSRLRLQEAMSGQFQLDRIRSAVKHRGVVGTTKAVGKRAMRAVRGTRGH